MKIVAVSACTAGIAHAFFIPLVTTFVLGVFYIYIMTVPINTFVQLVVSILERETVSLVFRAVSSDQYAYSPIPLHKMKY